jgi:hypothetical protein
MMSKPPARATIDSLGIGRNALVLETPRHRCGYVSQMLSTERPVRHKWAAPFLFSVIGMFLCPGFFEAQTMSAAKVCQLLPMADLEAHFGAKLAASRGLDRTTSSTVRRRPPGSNARSPRQQSAAFANAHHPAVGQRVGYPDDGSVCESLVGLTRLPIEGVEFLDAGVADQ